MKEQVFRSWWEVFGHTVAWSAQAWGAAPPIARTKGEIRAFSVEWGRMHGSRVGQGEEPGDAAAAPFRASRPARWSEGSGSSPAPTSVVPGDADTGVAALWSDYKTNATPEARERLILHYAPLVNFAAGRVSGCPEHVDQADLVSFGLFGLIDAIDKFDPGRGFKFVTYAVVRIKGAILDELRSFDWVPRRVRANARAIGRVRSQLERELRHSPSHAEIAAEIGMRPDHFERVRSRIAAASVVSLDEPVTVETNHGTSATLGDMIADPADPFESIETTAQSLAHAIGALPERDRLVLTLYYYEQLRLAEIGVVLGVTESRVSQICTKAIVALRCQLAKSEQETHGPRERVSARRD